MKKLSRILALFLLGASICLPTSEISHAAPMDSTQAPFIQTEITSGSSGVPIGTIIAWPVSSNPDDMEYWLECNGQSVSKSSYPELYAIVGSKTPDLRGYFLRGHGGKSLGLGVEQTDAIRNITGFLSGPHHGAFYPNQRSGSLYTSGGNMGRYFGGTGHAPNELVTNVGFDASLQVPVDEEVRPINKSVRYLIRAL